jgi:hypothetical protein
MEGGETLSRHGLGLRGFDALLADASTDEEPGDHSGGNRHCDHRADPNAGDAHVRAGTRPPYGSTIRAVPRRPLGFVRDRFHRLKSCPAVPILTPADGGRGGLRGLVWAEPG